MNLLHRIPNDPSRGGGLNNLRSTLSISRSVQSSKAPTVVSVDTSVLADLFEAIGEGKTEAVKNILATYNEPSLLLKRKDPQGLTPLKKAVALNKAEIVRILVSYGAAPSVRDPAGRTALHTAVMQGRRELIAPLLVSKDSCVNVQDSHGSTPLHFAVRGKHLKAINWLLYAGADINLRDKDDKTALDYCDEDSPVRAMLSKYEHSLDDGPLDLCCAFIGRKQLNQIGPDGLLMFVTSAVWSERMQFIFCIRIRPYRATPPIPLRLDEQYYSDVWHYRMMRRLVPRETRVKAYFRLFEELSDWEIVLKITSKRKYLGELPVSLSRYTQYNYSSFLAGAEIDLKDEGQFVMVKRPKSSLLVKDREGMFTTRLNPMFKMNVPDGSLPGPPANWHSSRYDREWEEAEAMMKNLMPDVESESEEKPTEKQVVWGDKNMSADVPDIEVTADGGDKGADDTVKEGEDGEERHLGENEEGEQEEEDWPGGIRPGTILEGDEPDECTDFYYISKGWGMFLQMMQPLDLQILLDKTTYERNILRCTTLFYKLFHTSKTHPTQTCIVQIPKTADFVKVGTVLVFTKRDLLPDEIEYPDPDDVPEEHFLSSDGKNPWGVYWINKEKERWSLIPTGIVNKQTRVIFETQRLATFIVVQLAQGTQKWEAEFSDESSSEEEDEEEMVEGKDVGEEGVVKEETGEEETEKEVKKKRKKKAASVVKLEVQESPEDSHSSNEEGPDVSNIEIVEPSTDEATRRETNFSGMDTVPESGTPQTKPSKFNIESDKKEPTLTKTRSSLRRKSSRGQEGPQSVRGSSAKLKEPTSDNDASNNRSGPGNASNNRSGPGDASNNRSGPGDASNNRSGPGDASNNRSGPGDASNNRSGPGDASNNRSGPGDANTSQNSASKTRRNSRRGSSGRKGSFLLPKGFDDAEENLPPEQRTVVSGLPVIDGSYFTLTGMRDLRASVVRRSIIKDSKLAVPEEVLEEVPEETAENPEEGGEGDEDVEVEEVESDEEIPDKGDRLFSLVQLREDGKADVLSHPVEGRRNHCECVGSVFTRNRDGAFDLVIELVKASELYVRAEHWWGEGYRMIAQTPTFPAKSGRLFTFLLDGPMIVDSPATNTVGSVNHRSMFYYLSTVSCLEYVVRKASRDDDLKPGAAKKGPKKKEELKADLEPDAKLDIMMYSPGVRTNGQDIASLNVFLNGPDLWHQRHVDLRMSDNNLLSQLTKILKKERAFKHRWWRAIILLGYPEKEIETEKGKTKWSTIISNLSTRWFEDNLNAPDRGILKLISVLDIMELHDTIELLLVTIREHKGTLKDSKKEPRYLKLLFHWVLNTKITKNSLMRLIDTQILKPVSDIFLLRLSVLLDPGQLFKIGAAMDVEDNVIHAIQEEDNIKDPVYIPFRVLIKSRQKKDEIIHYTLLLLEMTKQCNLPVAQNFVITETRKWMVTVADTEPDICAKLDNVFS
ncbi:hypothetical protein Btru_062486 [Bulinus truncatus]|nr:hypothetical protein Btru_062486 [Bulinus truncatus]